MDSAKVIDWRNARRAALLSGVIGAFGAFLPHVGLLLLWVFAAGGISITFYQRRVSHPHLSAASGFKIGAVAGLFAAILCGLLNMLPMLTQQGRVFVRQKIEQQASATIAANPDPLTQQTLRNIADWAATTEGLFLLVAVSILMITVLFTVLAGLGGSVGAAIFGKREQAS